MARREREEALLEGTGIGPALRKARALRGKSIDEASRETRIRAEYLAALERERFDELLGDVYVRAFLRSYSSYLGLDPDKFAWVYNRHFGPPLPTIPPAPAGPPRAPKAATPDVPGARRHHPSSAFLVGAALFTLGLFAAAGLLSRGSSPAAEEIAPIQASLATSPSSVSVTVKAREKVALVVRADGSVAFDGSLGRGESRTFEAASAVQVSLSEGATAELTVNGRRIGALGRKGFPYAASFDPADFRENSSDSNS